MKMGRFLLVAILYATTINAQHTAGLLPPEPNGTHPEENEVAGVSVKEKHFAELRQLTFGGDNIEANFSFDGKKLSFQSNNPIWGLKCHQTFWLDIEEASDNRIYQPLNISNLEGRTTGAYYMPDNKRVIYSSTFSVSKECPVLPQTNGRDTWPIDSNYDIFIGDEKGKVVKQITKINGYDAEAVISPNGDKILFTSTRNGDLDLYLMDISGKNVKQLTSTLGYDGGASFSADGTKIVFSASRPSSADTNQYKALLLNGFVAPTKLEIYTMNVDGTNLQQVTRLGNSNRTPVFNPSGNKIIFSSNHHSDKGNDFQLFMINVDGSALEQITFESKFNAFPMFSLDGKTLVFSSNRNNGETRDTNVFIVDWVE